MLAKPLSGWKKLETLKVHRDIIDCAMRFEVPRSHINTLKDKQMKVFCTAAALSICATAAFAEVKGEIGLSVGKADVDISGLVAASGDFDAVDFHTIIPVADQFGLYISHTTLDGTIGGLSADGNSTVLAVGYQVLDTMDRNAYTGAQILVGLGAMSSESTLAGVTGSDDTGVIIGRVTGYLGPKIRGSLSFVADTDDFDPAFAIGVGYEVGPGILQLGYSAESDSVSGIDLKVSGYTFGFTMEF